MNGLIRFSLRNWHAVIVLMLATFFLPATRHAGESARRNQCQNKLKQIGLRRESGGVTRLPN